MGTKIAPSYANDIQQELHHRLCVVLNWNDKESVYDVLVSLRPQLGRFYVLDCNKQFST